MPRLDLIARSGVALASSCLGGIDARSVARRPCLGVVPSFGGSGRLRALGDGVLVEPPSAAAGHHREDARVSVGHGDLSPNVGTGSATACATRRPSEWSSSETRRNPRTRSALGTCSGGSPQSGHATRYAAAARAKRNRQLGQQTWVMNDPFDRAREGKCSCWRVGLCKAARREVTMRIDLSPSGGGGSKRRVRRREAEGDSNAGDQELQTREGGRAGPLLRGEDRDRPAGRGGGGERRRLDEAGLVALKRSPRRTRERIGGDDRQPRPRLVTREAQKRSPGARTSGAGSAADAPAGSSAPRASSGGRCRRRPSPAWSQRRPGCCTSSRLGIP
jgi:hypothetical protein